MKDLNDIFKIVNDEHIILEEFNLTYKKIDGIYFKIPGLNPTIGIEKTIVHDRCKYISTLSEELGHHFTCIGDLTAECVLYSDKIQRDKKEHKAKLWAADFLISDEEFVQALCSCISTMDDISQYFNVTYEIVQYKILSISRDEDKYIRMRSNFMKRDIPYHCCLI